MTNKEEEHNWGTDHFTHHLLEIREPPPSIVELRNLLQEPQHADILADAQKATSFSEAIGTIAARLDIALDGSYDVDGLCRVLCTCLRGRFTNNSTPHLRSPELVNVELHETEDEVKLVEAFENTIDANPASEHAWTLYMQRVGCETCFNVQLCKSEGKCLKLPEDEAIKASPQSE